MKIKKIVKSKSPLIKLKLLRTKNYKKNYSMINLKIEDIQYRFVKSLKILHKYNSKNKKISFLNTAPTIAITLKRLLKKTKHIYASNYLLLKKNSNFLQSDLFITLTKKIDTVILKKSHQIKIPNIVIANSCSLKKFDFGKNYKILGDLLLKKSQHFLFFIFLYSIFKKHK